MSKLLNAKDILRTCNLTIVIRITIVRLQVQGTKKYFLLKQYYSMVAKSNFEYTLHKLVRIGVL